jgi:hypothetical protein
MVVAVAQFDALVDRRWPADVADADQLLYAAVRALLDRDSVSEHDTRAYLRCVLARFLLQTVESPPALCHYLLHKKFTWASTAFVSVTLHCLLEGVTISGLLYRPCGPVVSQWLRSVGNLHLEVGSLGQHDLVRILPDAYARSLVVSAAVVLDR